MVVPGTSGSTEASDERRPVRSPVPGATVTRAAATASVPSHRPSPERSTGPERSAIAERSTAAERDAVTGPERASREDAGGPVHRALAILDLLGSLEDTSSLGVVEIARQLGRDKSQVSRALKLLADVGFVDRDVDSMRYRIGTRLFVVSARAIDHRLRDEADRLVEREAARLGERVEVCVRSGDIAMTLSTAAPESELRAVGWIGRTVPLSSTAVGRALLMDFDPEAVARLLVPAGLASSGPEAPRSLDEVLVRLAADRARGYSLARYEMDRGFLAVGAPVRDAAGRIVAAVAAGGPASRIDPVLDETTSSVVAAGAELSVALGHRPGRRDRRSTTGGEQKDDGMTTDRPRRGTT